MAHTPHDKRPHSVIILTFASLKPPSNASAFAQTACRTAPTTIPTVRLAKQLNAQIGLQARFADGRPELPCMPCPDPAHGAAHHAPRGHIDERGARAAAHRGTQVPVHLHSLTVSRGVCAPQCLNQLACEPVTGGFQPSPIPCGEPASQPTGSAALTSPRLQASSRCATLTVQRGA